MMRVLIGTPDNAIVYNLAKDPDTGEQLLTTKNFLIHGFAVFLLSMSVLLIWVFLGY